MKYFGCVALVGCCVVNFLVGKHERDAAIFTSPPVCH